MVYLLRNLFFFAYEPFVGYLHLAFASRAN